MNDHAHFSLFWDWEKRKKSWSSFSLLKKFIIDTQFFLFKFKMLKKLKLKVNRSDNFHIRTKKNKVNIRSPK